MCKVNKKEDYEALVRDMEKELRRNEAMTDIVKYLQNDSPIEDVISHICKIICKYLDASIVGVAKLKQAGVKYISVGAHEEAKQGKWELILDKLKEHNIVLSENQTVSATDNQPVVNVLKESGVSDIVVHGIKITDITDMFLMVISENHRCWTDEELLFTNSIASMIHTVIERRIAKNSLAGSYEALKDILDNIGIGIYVIDKESKEILFSNKTMVKLIGENPTGHKCSEFPIGKEERQNCSECDYLKKSSFYREVYNTAKNAWYVIKNNDITWVDGRCVSLCSVTDVTDKKKYEKRIEFQANNDFLTGLYNRMRCEKDLFETISRAIDEGKSGMVMFIDLDNFKHLNDGLGHQFGDLLLKMISIGIQQIKGIENNCYRMGGDEFVILIEPENMYRAEEIIRSVEDLFKNPWYLNGTEYYCTMSMGVVCYPEDGTDVNELIKKADIAMYDAKKSGKNRVEYYNSEQEGTSLKRLDVENNMRSAVSLGCDEFKVYVQPIFDVATGKCIGGEALIRWDSENLGFLNPGDFIPLAENLGLINVIGDYFLELACRINKSWSDMGVDAHLNVNLSIVQLMQNSIVDNIKKIIEKTGVKPENIVLEVTESLAINDMKRMMKILSELKNIGVNIALDDFGTGYSSLSYIRQMSFDIIKVDKTFVDDIVDDDYSKTFVKLITELSEQLNVKVCIEGVETEEQLNTLKKMNVSMIQGFFYGKPMPYIEFQEKYLGIKK